MAPPIPFKGLDHLAIVVAVSVQGVGCQFQK